QVYNSKSRKEDRIVLDVSNKVKSESVISLQSTIRKLEKAYDQMSQKGVNTTLVKKRLNGIKIGLAILEYFWEQKPLDYTKDDVTEARHIPSGLLPAIQNTYAKLKAGSPQRTLLERRIKSLEIAIQGIDQYCNP